MNENIKKYIYIIGTICIVFLLGSIFIRILPWLLFVGLITYIIIKIVGLVKGKKLQKNSNKFDFNNRNDDEGRYKESTDDYTNGEVIDVEYEDVDSKEE